MENKKHKSVHTASHRKKYEYTCYHGIYIIYIQLVKQTFKRYIKIEYQHYIYIVYVADHSIQ